MEEVKKNIELILNQFGREHIGDTLKPFAFAGLTSIIIQELNKIKLEPKKAE